MFIISFSLFIFFVVLLHYRDKTLRRHLAEAEEAQAAAEIVKV